jgi:glutaryl-CoA dehydrogenase
MATFIGVHNGLALSSIDLCGSDEQRERWLPKMRSMARGKPAQRPEVQLAG